MDRKKISEHVSKDNISFMSFHDIDMATRKASAIDVSSAEDLREYIVGKLKYIIDHSKNCREFNLSKTERDTYDKILDSIKKTEDEEFCNNQAKLLTEKLITKQNNTTSDGGLVQVIFKHDTTYYYAFIKNEFEDVIERNDMKKVHAFIYGNKAPLKTCLFEISEVINKDFKRTFKLDNVFVDDSQTSPFAQFWYRDFLNLVPKLNDEFNTMNFLESAENYWNKVDANTLINIEESIKNIGELETDKLINRVRFDLYNQAKGFLTLEKTFRLEEYLEKLNKDHIGFELNNIEVIKEEFHEMATNDIEGFDKTFDIDKSILKKKRYNFEYKPQQNIKVSISGKVDTNLVYLKKDENQFILNIIVDDESDPDLLKYLKVEI